MRHRSIWNNDISEQWGISGSTVKLFITHKQSATQETRHFPGSLSPAEPGNWDVCGWKFRGCAVSLPTLGLEVWLVSDWDSWATLVLNSVQHQSDTPSYWQTTTSFCPDTFEAAHYVTVPRHRTHLKDVNWQFIHFGRSQQQSTG